MRLIDADALIAELEKDEDRFDREAEDGKQNPQNCTAGYAEAMWSRANGIRDAIISIYDAPTVDAVEVVRCKECKYRETCEQIVWFDIGKYKAIGSEIDFCSYGERRQDPCIAEVTSIDQMCDMMCGGPQEE